MSVKVEHRDTLDIVAQIIHLTASFEGQLEQIRQSLAAMKNFDPEQTYMYLSQAKNVNQIALTPKHIADLCIRCETSVSQRTSEIFFEH